MAGARRGRRSSPEPRRACSRRRGNFQLLPMLDFIAEFTQHIPPKGSHLIRRQNQYCTPESPAVHHDGWL